MSKSVTIKDLPGRKKELKQLITCLKEGENAAIIAPRRFGKSTLITQALQLLKAEDHYTACIDLFTNPTLDLLSSDIVKKVLKNLNLQKSLPESLEDFPFPSSFSKDSKDEWELLTESLDFPEAFSIKQQKRIFCAYEEVGSLLNFDPSGKLAELFRTKLEQHSHTSYIFSGSHESHIHKTLLKGKSQILKQENTIHLTYIDKKVLIESMIKRFSRLKLKVPRKYVNDIVRLTKGHPYYTQLAFKQAILVHALEGKIPRQKELTDRLLRAENSYLEKIWEDISRNKEYIQIMLALPGGSTNIYRRLKSKKINVARAQKNLEEMGLLFKNDQAGYSIADPLIELWIRKKI